MKGATDTAQRAEQEQKHISIHAPVKGATKKQHDKYRLDLFISIHAPVKGATAVSHAEVIGQMLFQSTHP